MCGDGLRSLEISVGKLLGVSTGTARTATGISVHKYTVASSATCMLVSVNAAHRLCKVSKVQTLSPECLSYGTWRSGKPPVEICYVASTYSEY